MKRTSHNFVTCVFAAMLLVWAQSAQAVDKEIRVGVLSFRSLEQTARQWQPTADYLNRHVPGHRFTFIAQYYKELDLAVNRHAFDFVLTNPEHYITVRQDHSLSAIATLMPLAEGHPVTQFGGVILTRADHADIDTLDDVRGRIVASPGEQSLGGYLMQRWELYKQGVGIGEMAAVHFTGMPHDKAVMEVLQGNAEVAFVRTGILESMAREGKIRMDQFRVLNQPAEKKFPQLLSTDLYPEWPFSAMPDVPEKLVKQVTMALLGIQPEDPAALSGKYYGFSPAGNYSPVEAIMARLKANPERAHEFNLRDVSRKYSIELILGGTLLLLVLVAAAMNLARTNRQLRASNSVRDRLDAELKLANSSLEQKVALRTQELQVSESRFRELFERHASPMLLIDPQSGAIVNANQAAAVYYGYQVGQLRNMDIAQINVQSQQELADERLQAIREERNYFVFPHRRANGEVRTVEVYASPVDIDGKVLLFSIVHDITERKQLEVRMHDMAFYDPLTKLPNRRLLIDRLNKALISCTRNRRHGALMFLDLDHFKNLNDLHGHDTGDQLLVEVASRILDCIREEDSAARFGGDEFVVMLEGLSDTLGEAVKQADNVAEKIRIALARPYELKRSDETLLHYCSSSLGVSLFGERDEDPEQLLKWTDMAMYNAKAAGRNQIRFFDPEMQTSIETRAALEADLRDALEQRQFELFYQIQVSAAGRPQGAEVLLRWHHPQRGVISPAQFIPLAEETGLIIPIGTWVLHTACAQISRWQNQLPFRNLVVAVNVSAKQFRQQDFVEQIISAVTHCGINPMVLKLELTESLVLDNVEDTIAKMKALKAFGISFSMDDFGTGYSSLSYLKRLPLDQLKIDQSFVRDITTDHGDRVMVMTIVDLGMNFEVDVIAEGVETVEQFKLLHRYGCGSFQGYLFSKPVPVEKFEALVANKLVNVLGT